MSLKSFFGLVFTSNFVKNVCVLCGAVSNQVFINMWVPHSYGLLLPVVAELLNIAYWALLASWFDERYSRKKA
jgi:hypothetical protein